MILSYLPRGVHDLACWLLCARSWPVARDRVEDDGSVFRRRLLPDEVPGIEDHEAAGGQPLVEKLRVWERDYAIVAAVDDRDWHGDLRQQPGKHRQFLGIPADVAHRLDEAVAAVAGQVVRADVVGYAARDRVRRRADDHARVHPAVLVEVGVEHPGRQRLAELDRDRGSAGAHDYAGDPLRMSGGREQGGRGSDVRADDVRGA